MIKNKYVIANTFNKSPYGNDDGMVFKEIIYLNGANPNASEFFPSNQITSSCTILEPVITKLDENLTDTQNALNMIQAIRYNLKPLENLKNNKLFVIGGDHTITIGTGAYLSQIQDLNKVGLIWVDAHSDFNTPQTSLSKSLTGYPCAVVNGIGDQQFLGLYSSFVNKTVQVGIRDVDQGEADNLKIKGVKTYSNLDIEELGLPEILKQSLDYLKDCDYIWLSLDIDALDTLYVDDNQTDVPVVAGLTPREMLYITNKVNQSGKLRVCELVQINNKKNNQALVALGNRIVEIAMDLGSFRINQGS
jgi:arginase